MRSRFQPWTGVLLAAATLVTVARPSLGCVGDCNGDEKVTIDELLRAVDVALGTATLDTCDAVDNNRNGVVSIDELLLAVSKGLAGCSIGAAGEVLIAVQSGQLDEHDLATGARTTIVQNAHVIGQACLLPGGSGNFVVGESTFSKSVPGGWDIFSPDGTFLREILLPVQETQALMPSPIGCAVDAQGRLYSSDFGGRLIVYFPPDYTTNCTFDQTARAPGTLALDDAGNLYVPQVETLDDGSLPGRVLRFAPPFPSNAAECGSVTPAKTTFIEYADAVPSLGIARRPNGHWLVAVGDAANGIREHDASGAFIREILPPGSGGAPQSLAVDSTGTLYYADLTQQVTVPPFIATRTWTVRKIAFDATDEPSPPELIGSGSGSPPVLSVFPSRADEWLTLGGSLRRTFFNPRERLLNPETATNLVLKWRYLTSGLISAQAAVVWLDLPGEGRTQVVIVPSWDQHVYALRAENGSRVWQYEMKPQPGTFYPFAGSPTIAWLDGTPRVYVPGGETMYCLDAVTGHELWHFDAGTGCTNCTVRQERNEIESTPAVINGLVIASMDVNDDLPGNGGMFALRAADGRLVWWLDLFSQTTCRPLADDNVRGFDGFHTTEQLGLPADFFATRPGCDFPRIGYGCGNVWSSPAIDARRGLIYTASANCETDDDPTTPLPPSPPPPYEEAIFAVTLNGDPAWHWRPREVDPDDLDFGAVPNLFEATIGGQVRDVLGVGCKDGTYYVLDRDGVNAITGVVEPYWRTNVVPGGPAGGMIGSASVGEGRIVVATAPGFSVFQPQKPSVHAFNPDTGAVVWENSDVGISFGPTMGVPGLALTCATPQAVLNIFKRDDGTLLKTQQASTVPGGIAAGSTIVGNMLFVGGGTGAHNSGSDAEGEAVRDTPLSAFCVQGTPGCVANTCNDNDTCTYDYRNHSGTCVFEPSADGIDCKVGTAKGTCANGTCLLTEPVATPTPGEG